MTKPRKPDDVDKLVADYSMAGICRGDLEDFKRRIRSLMARRDKKRLKSAYNQGLDCRIHGKSTKKQAADCSFEKCFLNNPLYKEKT